MMHNVNLIIIYIRWSDQINLRSFSFCGFFSAAAVVVIRMNIVKIPSAPGSKISSIIILSKQAKYKIMLLAILEEAP